MQQPTRPPAFTRLQATILILFALLGIFWIVFAAVFLLTGGFGNTRPSAPAAENQAVTGWAPSSPVPSPAPSRTPEEAAPAVQPPLVPPTACAQQNSGVWPADSALVLDDGTLEVLQNGAVIPVRLASVRLPGDGPLLDQAVQAAQRLFEGQDVLLVKDTTEQDEAGRQVRYVFAGGQFVNYELVRQGVANAVLDSPDLACVLLLRQAEQQARGDRLGMWNPIPAPTATFIPFVTLDPDQAVCDCSIRYTCSAFKRQAQAQACYNACNDYHSRLDLDRDGIACEGLP